MNAREAREALMKYCPIIPSENDFTFWSEYKIALQKYERELQTFTKTYETLKKAFEELEELKQKQEKKDKLLELYRECNKEGYFWLEIQQRIKALEEELK